MDANAVFVRNCYRKCCIWGKKYRVGRYKKPYKGGATPLWRNPQKSFFHAISVINIIVFLTITMTYFIQDSTIKNACSEIKNTDSTYFQAIIFSFLNTFLYLFMSKVNKGSD
jgi:hypothetical protein